MAGSTTSLGREGAAAHAAGSVQKRTAAVELARAAAGVRGLRWLGLGLGLGLG